ncbi:MAG: DUF4244 domain-containing protein [Actinomycetota bacterium]
MTNPSTTTDLPTRGTRRLARLGTPVRSDRGQATAEYALVLLAAAALAGLLLAWATSSDGIARLMDAVLDQLIGDVTS